MVVVSKWDINEVDLDDLRERIDRKLRQRPPVITTSAVTGRGLERAAGRMRGRCTATTRAACRRRAVNRLLKEAAERQQAPLVGAAA